MLLPGDLNRFYMATVARSPRARKKARARDALALSSSPAPGRRANQFSNFFNHAAS
jgi:hypothetical protein